MLMRTDPFRDLDRLTQQVFGTPARPAAMPIDAYRHAEEFVVELDLPGEELDSFKATAQKYTLETLHQKLILLMTAVEEIRHSSQPRLALETSFLKIIEAGNVVAVTTLLGQLEQLLGREPAAAAVPAQPPAAPPASAPSPQPAAASPASPPSPPSDNGTSRRAIRLVGPRPSRAARD